MIDAGQTSADPRARELHITEHAVRNSITGAERTWSLGADALEWREGAKTGRIPYGDVTEMRLISFKSSGTQYQCTLRARGSGKFKIRSHHYRSLGSFEDRSTTYGPFMRALARRIAEHAPDAKFMAGSTAMWFVWLIIGIMWFGISLLLIAMLASGETLGGDSLWILVLAGIVAPIVIHQLRQGRGKTFDPQDPPATVLGTSD